MSWYVEQLLRFDSQIKNLIQDTVIEDIYDDELVATFIVNDSYDDLLTIDTKIAELERANLLSERERKTIQCLRENKTVYQISEDLGFSWQYVNQEIAEVCDRIAFLLGGVFTDDGFIAYMTKKHNLSDEEKLSLTTYIHGKYKIHRGKKIDR